ncbi:MAG: ROK family protein [Mobilicoccus sp.]|nr:ROK family protein [Mobilicoccus sp.]
MNTVLALDIGGTKIAAGLVEVDGAHDATARITRRVATPTGGRDAVLSAAIDLAREVVGERTITAVGIGSAGVIDPDRGVVTSATDALPGWVGADLRGTIGQALGVGAVGVLNDVHAHALGEARYGAGRGAASMLLVAVGTGVGGAHVVEGRVLTGAHHVAGHVGHLPCPAAAELLCTCGRYGHLEALASGPGTLAAFRRAGGVADRTEDVARLAASTTGTDTSDDESDAELARRVLTTSGYAVGQAVGGLLNMLDPEVVVLTGGMAAAGEHWRHAVDEGRRATAMDPVTHTPVRAASGGVEAALLGAAAHAVDVLHAGDAGAPDARGER